MKQKTIATGILLLCLVTTLLMAGCMSQNTGSGSGQPAVTAAQPQEAGGAPQGTPAAEISPASPDQGLVSDDVGNAVDQADAINTTQETNLTADSPDLGDILP